MSDEQQPTYDGNRSTEGEPSRANTAPSDPPTHPGYADSKPPRKPTRLSTSTARRRRAERTQTFEFDLPNTLDDDGNPTSALVRKPEIFDLDELQQLPDHLQQSVFSLIQQTEKAEGTDEDVANTSVFDLAHQLGGAAAMAEACCLRGFVDPKCYSTADEADANDGVWVKDIDAVDRMNFFNLCTGEQKAVADTVAGFREQPVDAVQPRPSGDAVPEAGQSEQHPAFIRTVPEGGTHTG